MGERGVELILLVVVGLIFLMGNASAIVYVNQSDGFSTLAAGAANFNGITTNGSDFWIVDNADAFVYHFDRNGNNISDGFSTLTAGSGNEFGITTNGSDFWIIRRQANFVHHFDRNGNNISDGFSTSVAGASSPYGITTNGSDFWVVDVGDEFIYHFNRAGTNCTGANCEAGFFIGSALLGGVGAVSPQGITTNGSDFWVVDWSSSKKFVYHLNHIGGNQTDGFSTLIASSFSIGSGGITTNQSYLSIGSDLWIGEGNGLGKVYHFSPLILSLTFTNPPVNNTNSSNINFDVNYTVFNNSKVDSIWYANDTYSVANKSLGSGGTYFNITNITWGQGKHNVTIYINDSYNNLNWSTISFTIDTTLPDINITFPSSNNTNTNNVNYSVNVTFSDFGTGIESVWYSNDTYSVNLSLGSGGTYFNITNVTWGQGKHNVTIYVNDSANNLNFSTISFTIDTTSSTISFICSPSSVKSGDAVTCTCSATDSLSGVQTISYTQNPSTTNTGTFSETCTATDYAGNIGSATANYIVEGIFSGGGGTSGGGGGTISIEPVSEKTSLISSISPEAGVTISDLDSQQTLIKEIQIEVNEPTENVKIDLKAYNEKPNEVSEKQDGTIYKYLKIETQNLTGKIETARINFQIEKSKTNKSFDKNNVALFKFDQTLSEWIELPTNSTSEDENYYFYEAELKSFSYFLIGEKTKNLVEIATEKIAESYGAASKHFLTLILWWLVYSAIIVSIMLAMIFFIDFFTRNYEFASRNLSAFAIYWLAFSVLIVSAMIFILIPMNFLVKNYKVLSYTLFGLAFLWLTLSILVISAVLFVLLLAKFYSKGKKQ